MIGIEMLEFLPATNFAVLSIYPQMPQADSVAVSYGKDAFAKNLIPLDDCAVAAHEDGICIGAYGIVEMWPGVARAWALFSEKLLSRHPILLALHVKRDLKRADARGLHRIEATTGAEHDTACAFLMRLGFNQECLMRRYTPTGEDSYLYAKVQNVI